jgi:hypothetical protein
VLDGLLYASYFCTDFVIAALHRVETVRGLDVRFTSFLQRGFDGTQLSGHGLQLRFVFLDPLAPIAALFVQGLVAQGEQFGFDAALLVAQHLESLGAACLPLQLFKLFIDFLP